MLNINTVASIAKFLFPAKTDVIGQAASMAQGFRQNKDGVAQLMAQYGKKKADLQNALKMLDSPMAKTLLGKVPGLENALRSVGSEVQNIEPTNREMPIAKPTAHSGAGSQGSLAERLAKLK